MSAKSDRVSGARPPSTTVGFRCRCRRIRRWGDQKSSLFWRNREKVLWAVLSSGQWCQTAVQGQVAVRRPRCGAPRFCSFCFVSEMG
ncbi:hypothetical protein EPI10_029205 [Gossypium australe]|uniref:Uncharacterized protein n=1 Tax=Gossypium australe TaxID=47621 RepID=A0A5B6V0S9_9ROSI|nr:hypothetical protein EPI10_029205 [Gossypium australe]